MKTRWTLIAGVAAILLTACAVEGPDVRVAVGDPYYYSPAYCAGCWYGQWNGRAGYHRGGGRPWERTHYEADHHREDRGRDVRHDGHY